MTYRMQRKQGEYEKGDAGIGRIRFSEKGDFVQAIINVKVDKDNFEQRTHLFSIDDCPDNIQLARTMKEWMIQTTKIGLTGVKNPTLIKDDKLMSFRPVVGVFKVVTKEFASGQNEEPTPKHKDVEFIKDGKKHQYSYSYFTVLLSILDEKFKGLVLPLILRYQFAEFVENGKSIAGFSMGGKYTQQLEEYMKIAGILEEKYQPMEWQDNLLPTMQRIALHEEREFSVTMKDGWIIPGSLIPSDEVEDDDIPFDVDPKEVKKSSASGASDESETDDEIDFAPPEMEFEPTQEFID